MALTLKESRVLAEIADLLYRFLPGSGNAKWKGHVSFRTVAEKVGVGDFFMSGSKLPMITALLSRTLEYKSTIFESLILEIVRAGLIYCEKSQQPIRPEEIDKLNGLLVELGFKFPDLWDPAFIEVLSKDGSSRAKEHIKQALDQEKIIAIERSQRSIDFERLKQAFYALHSNPNHQQVGFEFEKILNQLFSMHNLLPRGSFQITGEQIDGAFELDHETYLLEAKWTKKPCAESDLLVFRGKIEGKSAYTRGVFVSINGISEEASIAINTGKQPTFFIINGHDIAMIFEKQFDVADFLRKRQRLLAEEGRLSVPFNDLR